MMWLTVLFLSLSITLGVESEGMSCITLTDKVTYEQKDAPTGITDFVGIISHTVNHQFDNVLGVKVVYAGDAIHAHVGKYEVTADVERLVGEDREKICVVIPFEISDSDECSLPEGHPMHHNCDPSATCINTEGSYMCECAEGLVGSGKKCTKGDNSEQWTDSRGKPLGDQHEVCGCTEPKVDWCAEMECPPHSVCTNERKKGRCTCAEGYVHTKRFGCVDATVPVIKLVGPKELRLKQTDAYEEEGVIIEDENAEDYTRALQIQYSRPLGACLGTPGKYTVEYTIQTPWTDPPFQKALRHVIVEQANLCAMSQKAKDRCPSLVPHCSERAVCTPPLGTCKCPPCFEGDGLRDGSGCKDVCPPLLSVRSPGEVFKTCKCSGLLGGDLPSRRDFDTELKEIVRTQGGDALCRQDRPCVTATDDGRDVTDRITVGLPVREGEYTWKLPYDAYDEAGNRAKTVYRTITVQEVSLEEMEGKGAGPKKSARELNRETPSKDCPPAPKVSCPPCKATVCPPCENVTSTSGQAHQQALPLGLLVLLVTLSGCCIMLLVSLVATSQGTARPSPKPSAKKVEQASAAIGQGVSARKASVAFQEKLSPITPSSMRRRSRRGSTLHGEGA
ncbi:unnamed protein product [Chrysoparadoxa australica]